MVIEQGVSSNRRKVSVNDYFYHLYNRGWNRSEIFIEDRVFTAHGTFAGHPGLGDRAVYALA